MSIRPRYSLLALMLLTAGVAVSVKLWRGPHRAQIHSPALGYESQLLGSIEIFPVLRGLGDTWIEYDFVNTFEGRQFSTVFGELYKSDRYFLDPWEFKHNFHARTPEFAKRLAKLKELYPDLGVLVQIGRDHNVYSVVSKEKVHYWVTMSQLGQAPLAGSPKPLPECYLITDRRVYEYLDSDGWVIAVRPIKSQDIPNLAIRLRVAEELNRSDQPRFNPATVIPQNNPQPWAKGS